jgi:predicted RNA polymerase sigma factor
MSCRKAGPGGSLILMAEQDRSMWDRSATEEGIVLVTAALPRGPIGPYQLQAAIAALHDEAQSPEATDWPQIAALYDVLLRLDDDPVVAPDHAVAISMVAGPGPASSWSGVSVPTLGSTPIVASTRSAAT